MLSLSPLKKLNLIIKATSLFRVPLLALCNPKLRQLSPTAQVEVPLNFLTKNHYRTMYFGALAMGAELSVAVPVLEEAFLNKKKINFIFKDMKCEFLKRADDDVIFEYKDIEATRTAITEVIRSQQRVNLTCQGHAYSKKNKDQIFMTYQITISMKAL